MTFQFHDGFAGLGIQDFAFSRWPIGSGVPSAAAGQISAVRAEMQRVYIAGERLNGPYLPSCFGIAQLDLATGATGDTLPIRAKSNRSAQTRIAPCVQLFSRLRVPNSGRAIGPVIDARQSLAIGAERQRIFNTPSFERQQFAAGLGIPN